MDEHISLAHLWKGEAGIIRLHQFNHVVDTYTIAPHYIVNVSHLGTAHSVVIVLPAAIHNGPGYGSLR